MHTTPHFYFFSKPLLLLLVTSFVTVSNLKGQSTVTGKVSDDPGAPVAYANVLLLSASDSSLVKGAVTNDEGTFVISNFHAGTYFLRVMMVGYSNHDTPSFSIDEKKDETLDFNTLLLHEDAVMMNEVQVVAKKPLFEQKVDRMVINVASSITSSGLTILEVLERSPGVMVNRQSNSISLSGKSGVVVMINGRINYMPADAITQLLDGMSSDNIERIEIITTPPAGFDGPIGIV